MSKCKSCGAEIDWIVMKSGRRMPVDPEPVHFSIDKINHSGDITLITADGMAVTGFKDMSSRLIGYLSHFATCPNADKHRRRK